MYFPPYVKGIIERLNSCGHSAYAVGGCVRDMLLGLVPHDYDIATSATPQEIRSIFESTYDTGSRYGTITVIYLGHAAEVTTYRKDGVYKDGRRPESVEFSGSIADDLSRRDFTINAMAASPLSGIIDPFSGRGDLEKRTIRCVGDPQKRFGEDALRIVRAFRFASQLGFDIESETLSAALRLSGRLSKISAERILSELIKAITGAKPSALGPLIAHGGFGFLGVTHAENLDVLDGHMNALHRESAFAALCFLCGVRPKELCIRLKSDRRLREVSADIFYCLQCPPYNRAAKKRALALLSEEYIYDVIYLCALLGRFSKTAPEEAVHGGAGGQRSGGDKAAAPLKASAADADFSGKNGAETNVCASYAAAELGPDTGYEYHRRQTEDILHSGEAYKLSMLAVNGSDIVNLSEQGRQTGHILDLLLQHVIEHPEENERERLLELAREYINQNRLTQPK